MNKFINKVKPVVISKGNILSLFQASNNLMK